jgi:hypothetical protein
MTGGAPVFAYPQPIYQQPIYQQPPAQPRPQQQVVRPAPKPTTVRGQMPEAPRKLEMPPPTALGVPMHAPIMMPSPEALGVGK